MKMFLTRIGFGSKVIVTGDASQKDLAVGTQSGLDVAEKVLGRQSYTVKKRHISIVICSDMEYTRDVDEKFLRTVSQFELSADIQREDGVFENIVFDSLYPVEIDLDIDWIFETENQTLIRKLLEV